MLVIVILALMQVGFFAACDPVSVPVDTADSSSVTRAFEKQQRDVQVQGEGVVTGILSDDKSGIPHQRFVVKLSSGHTVLVQHNTNLAPRITALNEGDTVSFSGEYVWNEQGGLIHWTHHDPAGRHAAGWVKHRGHIYQ